MAEGVSNTDRDDCNLPPLHKACARGSLSDAKTAIQQCGYTTDIIPHAHGMGYNIYSYTAFGVKDEYGCLPVHYACQHSHDDALDLVKLVSDGCDLNTVACIRSIDNGLHRDCKYHNKQNKPSGQTPLHVACKSGHSDLLSFLIDKGSQYLVNCFGQEPLHVACICGNLSVAKLLIEKYGHKICSHRDKDKCLPLHYACQHNSLELVKLVSQICDVNVVACVKTLHSYIFSMYHSECSYSTTQNEATGQTPLHIACKEGHLDVEIITFLLGKVKHADKVKNCFNQTLLHMACMRGNSFIAGILINKYGYGMCTVRDGDQCLPLHYACQHDSLELVKLVSREQFTAVSCLKSWYSMNHDDCRRRGQVNEASGQTPLHIAAIAGCVQIVSFLLDKIYILNCHEQNLLHVACAQGNTIVAEMIIKKYGYEMCTVQDRYGCLPLHYACQHDSLELVELASNACNVNTLSNDSIGYGSMPGETPLHVACKACIPTIVRYLCKVKDCDLRICNNEGNIAYKVWPNREGQLHRACQSGVPGLVKYIFQERVHDCMLILRDPLKSPFALWPNEDEQLHEACKSGIHELFAYLIQVRKCDPNVKNSSGLIAFELWPEKTSQLHIACRYGATQSVIYLVEKKEYSVGALVFHEACRSGVPDLVKYLVEERKCDCSTRTGKLAFEEWPDGRESLHDACKSGVIQLVEYLLHNKKCDTSIKDSKGQLPLHIACQENSLRMVKLVSSNCDANTADSVNKYTPLHIACKPGYVDIAMFLVLEKCCSLFVEDVLGRTPFDLWPSSKDQLRIACTSGFPELVHYLVKQRKCVPSNYQGESVFRLWPKRKEQLHTACKSGIPELVQYVIINRKCDITLRNNDGKVAFELWPEGNVQLHDACRSGVIQLVEYLLDNEKCDTRIKDSEGQLPLHIACQENSLRMVQLVSSNCDVNTADSVNEYTPLHIACKQGYVDIAMFLVLGKCCSLSVEDVLGKTPFDLWPSSKDQLQIACTSDFSELVHYLVKQRKCVPSNYQRENIFRLWPKGKEQLHIACKSGIPELVRYVIINRKCDITLRNKDGKIAFELWPKGNMQLHEACRSGVPDLVKYLVEERKCDCSTRTGKLAFEEWPDGRESLHDACRSGVIQLVEYLLHNKKCDTSIKDSKGQLPLHMACQENSLRMVQLVSSNCDVNTADSVNEYTPLHIACKPGYVDIAMFLVLEKCCSLSVEDVLGRSPFDLWPSSKDQLQIACTSGFPELVHYLVKQRKCVPSNYQGESIFRLWPNRKEQLHTACKSGIPELMRYVIINRKCDISLRNNDGKGAFELWPKGNVQLHDACRSGVIQLVEYLLDNKKCDASIKDSKGRLPLHIACQENSLRMVQLVSSNCDVNTADSVNKYTPLHIACKPGYVDIAMFLVSEKCCSLSVEDVLGKTPFDLWPSSKDQLQIACTSGFPELVDYLVKRRKCVPSNYQGESIFRLWPKRKEQLHTACKSGIPELVRYVIINRKCDITLRNKDGKIAFELWPKGNMQLHDACRSGVPDLVKYLVEERKCDCTSRNKSGKLAFEEWPDGRESLHGACRSGVIQLVEYLLDNEKCDTRIKDSEGQLPLHIACRENSLRMVQLVSSNCDANTADCVNEYTPLHIACKQGYVDIAMFLVSEKCCSLSVEDVLGRTPFDLWPSSKDQLRIACTSGFPELVHYLVKQRKCVPSNYQGESIVRLWPKRKEQLHTACKSGIPELMRYVIINRKCDITLRNKDGKIAFELWPKGNMQLHDACRSGVPDLVKYLVEERKCDCSSRNKSGKLAFEEWPDGRESLHDACRSGVIQLVEYLLDNEKCDTRIKNSKGQLPLHIACQENSLRMVKLVSSNCDANTADSVNEYTPLHIACKQGYVDIAMFLVLEKYCSLFVEDVLGRTPFNLWPSSKDQLRIACTSGFPELVHYLVKQRKCVPSNYQGESVFRLWPKRKEQLHTACKSGIPELVRYVIINRKCDITLRNKDGKIAFELWPKGNMQLHDACRSGVPDLVKYLVEERKCDCTSRNKSGKLAFEEWPGGIESLHDACRSGVIQLVEYLLDNEKCDTRIKDSKGQLPLHIACQENSLRIVQLVSSNCDANTADCVNEYTPLHIACKQGYVDIAMFLVSEKCCSLSVEDVLGRTPFNLWPSSKDQIQIACTSDLPELIHYLVKQRKCVPSNYQGESVFRLWPKGKEQLHIACKSGVPELVRYLVVNRKCDITLRNSDGKVAFEFWPEGKEQLHEAYKSGIPELVKYLTCERRCDFTTLNHNKKLVFELWPVSDDQLHEACKSGILEFVIYLIEERKCDLNSKNPAGEIPLHIACRLGYSSLTQMLCTSQNVNITSSNGSSPLHIACDNERKDIVIFLIQQMHARCNIQDENGELPLHIACRKLTLTEVMLLSDDCDVNTVSHKRERPFDIAVCRNVPDIISYLVDVRKCDIAINRDEQNPFLIKVRSRLKNMETKPLKIAKLMITGAPRVGKSSFKNRLVGKLMLFLSPSTSAIDAPTLVMMKHITHISATPVSRGLPWEEISIRQQVDNLIEPGQSGEADVLLRESISVHIIDTGGQPEFHKILPILITGPAINLILFKLNEELWERCVIEFVHKDGSFKEPYVTSYTHEDVIFQTISSVSCFTQPSAITYSKQEDMEHSESHCNDAVCVLVGTHKDDSKVTKEVIERANDYLAKKLEKTYANCDGLIEKYHDSTIAAISNKDPDDTKAGIADFRDFLTSLIHEKCQIVDIPPRWFSFQLHLKSNLKVLKLKDCKAIARKCGIEKDQEFDDVLTYLHYHVGTLLWYRQVTMYKDLVIVNIQSLYDRITELMANTFTKANVHDKEYKLFKDKGQFTSSVLARESKKNPGYFSFDHLIHLLQYLHIATCIKKSKSKKMKKETVYFMPCVLRSAEVESLFHSIKAFPHPLLVQFDCGFCPVGVFCFLIVELLECSSLKWELCDEETQYSNMMILRAGKDYDKVTLIEKNTYYEIRIEPDCQFTEPSLPYHTRCHQVKQCVHESLQNVTKRLNYSRLSEHKFAFFCPRRECQQKYCIAVERSMDTKDLKCLRCKKPSPVPSQCLYWYGEEGRIKPDDIQSPTTITTSEIDIYPLGKFISSLNFVRVVVIPT